MNFWATVLDEILFPGHTKFSAADVPDMSGKVTLVTGATGGIGKETARVLLTKNAKVWVTAHDMTKGEVTLKELKDAMGKDAHLLVMDLANLKSIQGVAQEFNFGVMIPPMDMLMADGYDLQFGTNILGHFYFTKLILPMLLSTVKSASDGIARVVNTASNGHWIGNLEYDFIRDGPAWRKRAPMELYGQSKTGNVVFAMELTQQYGNQGIVLTSLNPGRNYQNRACMACWDFPPMSTFPQTIFLQDMSYGAVTQLYAGTIPNGKSLNGKYLILWARLGIPHADTQDLEVGRQLWAYLEEQVKNI